MKGVNGIQTQIVYYKQIKIQRIRKYKVERSKQIYTSSSYN